MAEPIRVLVVGDHGPLRVGLAAEEDIEVVGGTADAATARSLAAEHLPDLVVLDLCGPYEPLAVTSAITRAVQTTRVVVTNAGDDEARVFEAVRAGAVGHVPASTPGDEVVEAIREVHHGGSLVGPGIAGRIIDEFATMSRPPGGALPLPHLTDRELEVLELTAGRHTNREIADRLSISVNTVRNHLRNVLGKLHLSARFRA